MKNITVNKKDIMVSNSDDDVSQYGVKHMMACGFAFSILFGSQFLNYII